MAYDTKLVYIMWHLYNRCSQFNNIEVNEIIVNFVSEKKKRRVDRLLNLSGIVFLFLSIIGLGSKGGIPSFSMILGSYFFGIILVSILTLIILFLLRKNLYKEGKIVLAKDSFALKGKKLDKSFSISDLTNFKISITDKEGYENFVEFEADNFNNKLFFAFKKEEDYYQIKDQYNRKHEIKN